MSIKKGFVVQLFEHHAIIFCNGEQFQVPMSALQKAPSAGYGIKSDAVIEQVFPAENGAALMPAYVPDEVLVRVEEMRTNGKAQKSAPTTVPA